MKPPKNAILYETPISTHWVDKDGIVCSVSKRVERKVEHYEKIMEIYRKLIMGGEKLCLLSDSRDAMPQTKEIREFLIAELPKYLKAHAILSGGPMDPSLNSTIMRLSYQGFPVMIFTDEKEAKKWLNEFM